MTVNRGFAVGVLVACGCGLCGANGAAAGTIPVDADIQDYLDLAQDAAYDAVGMFSWDGGLASGTYIGNGWVLTAAHVAEASDSLSFTLDGVEYTSDEIVINDQWTGDVRDGGDLALVKLTDDVTGVAAAQLYDPDLMGLTDSDDGSDDASDNSMTDGIPGIDLSEEGFGQFGAFGRHHGFHGGRFGGFRDPFFGHGPWQEQDDDSLLGTVVTFVGYGMTGDGETGAVDEAGVKIAGQNTIDLTGTSLYGYDNALMFVDFDDPDAEDSFPRWLGNLGDGSVDLEYLIASGDSGGGVFYEDENGVNWLLGVNSFLLAYDGTLNADYGDLAGFTSVESYLDWIYDITGLYSTDETSETSVVDSVLIPDPSTLMSALSGVTLMMLRRRKA